MLGCTIDVFSSIYMFFFVHFKVERAVIPKRWVVERSFAWIEKCRRIQA
ncbi:hypothetical protein RHABOEDO_000267 [Candidatus Rhabdochlamydia oedothoracis]|uniref:Transposase DDE domain-containing protein n=1 Tax=Candidatus Rhabdochlamydia oedothoracis TaxID=2720720 RepID=A0ABX8V544_9BACT|nr:hypothetical protein RHABOEDO_000267 [Candidatus Rhabdochlamydia oedothoracis]